MICKTVSIVIAAPFFYRDYNRTIAIIGLIYGIVLIISTFFRFPTRDYETEIKIVENELELLKTNVDGAERRAEYLFKRHQFDLQKYYDQTLKHSSWIFYVGIICILLGFGIIGYIVFLISSINI